MVKYKHKSFLEGNMRTFILTLVLTVAFFIGGIFYFGGDFGLFFAPSPLIILVLFPLIFQCILYGKFFKKAFITAFEKMFQKTICKRHIIFLGIMDKRYG
jgi:flagellar motor component MotA